MSINSIFLYVYAGVFVDKRFVLFLDIWYGFAHNSRKCYISNSYLTVGEQLFIIKVRRSFFQFIYTVNLISLELSFGHWPIVKTKYTCLSLSW